MILHLSIITSLYRRDDELENSFFQSMVNVINPTLNLAKYYMYKIQSAYWNNICIILEITSIW